MSHGRCQCLAGRRRDALRKLVGGYEILYAADPARRLAPHLAGLIGRPGPPAVRGYLLRLETFLAWVSHGVIARAPGRCASRGWQRWRVTPAGRRLLRRRPGRAA